jgi:putative phosphoesterase
MRIGIISDTHDRTATVAAAVRLLRERGVELVLHCGDIASIETVRQFEGLPTHFVFGNWDGDWISGVNSGLAERSANGKKRDDSRLRRAIQDTGGTLHEPFGDLELAGHKIAWVHGNDREVLRELERCAYFDYLFYGHTHLAEQHQTGCTRVINPGALFRAEPKTFAVLDLGNGQMESAKLA